MVNETLPELNLRINETNNRIIVCRKCSLSKTRNNPVPGEGDLQSKIMFVGEAPGGQEDIEGRPFVGQAGKLLNELLEIIHLKREDVFITNVVKCRPPENRDPLEDEKKLCLPYLRKQVSLIKPALICTLGNHAMKTLINKDLYISQVHGRIFRKKNYIFVALYHPAAALYNQKLKDVLIKDILNLETILKENEPVIHTV